MAVETNSDKWREWVAQHGSNGVLRIRTPELLPPGLKETLEFGTFQLFLPSHVQPSIAVDQGDCVEVRVNAGLISEETNEAGTINRRIRTGGSVEHVLFGLPKLLWNRGNARRMLRSAIHLYDQLEIDAVRLRAMGLGKYVWAASGFDFGDEETREAVSTALRLFASELELFDDPLPEFEHSWDVLALDLDPSGRKLYVGAEKLAAVLKERGEVRLIEGWMPGRLPPSKALYLYSRYDHWDGTLDLHHGSPSRTQLERYVADVL